jgi:hypothetical protein
MLLKFNFVRTRFGPRQQNRRGGIRTWREHACAGRKTWETVGANLRLRPPCLLAAHPSFCDAIYLGGHLPFGTGALGATGAGVGAFGGDRGAGGAATGAGVGGASAGTCGAKVGGLGGAGKVILGAGGSCANAQVAAKARFAKDRMVAVSCWLGG